MRHRYPETLYPKRLKLIARIIGFVLGLALFTPAWAQTQPSINVVTDYGAIADAIQLSDVSNNGTTLSSPSHQFVAADVGKVVSLYNGGSSFGNGLGAHYTITAVSGGNAILSTTPLTTVTNGLAQVCTDTTSAFINARNFLITKNPTKYTFNVPAGAYCLNSTHWLKGITNVDVVATGASFINMTSNAGYQIDGTAMSFGGDLFSNAGDGPFDPSTNTSGQLIQTAAIGASSVTMITATDTSNFHVGDDVLIFGFDAQGTPSYPPNPRYFEFNTVTAINAATGAVTLQNPLKYAYLTDWLDATPVYGVTTGAPRMLDLDRTNMHLAHNITFMGGTFLTWMGSQNASARQVSGTISISGGLNITVTGVTATGIFAGQTQTVNLSGGTYQLDSRGDGYSEFDKIIPTLNVNGGTYQNLIQGTGIKIANFTGATFTGECQLFAETQVYTGNTFNCNPALSANYETITGGSWWTPNQTFTNNVFNVTSGIGGITNHYNQITYIVAASPAPTATSLSVPFSSGITQSIEIGEVLTGTGAAAGKQFTITKFFCNQASTCTITGTPSAGPPLAGEVYYNNLPPIPIVSSGNIFADSAEGIFTVPPTINPAFNPANGKEQFFSLSAGSSPSPTIANGTVTGQSLGFIICQTATSTNTFHWPSNTNQAVDPGVLPNTCSFMPFTWNGSLWQAVLPNGGSVNQPNGTAGVAPPPPPSCRKVTAAVTIPVNSAPPVITGTLIVGNALSVSNGTWSGNPTSFTYQWFWDDTSIAITGATASTYTLQSTDVGHTIHATVTAVNSGGSSIPSPALCPT
jgi:hypothetical protein